MALYRLAANMKNSQNRDWLKIAQNIPDMNIRSCLIPKQPLIQPEKLTAQTQKSRQLSRQVMTSADLLPGSESLSSRPYTIPVMNPFKSHKPIPLEETSYDYLPSINELCDDSDPDTRDPDTFPMKPAGKLVREQTFLDLEDALDEYPLYDPEG